MVDLNSAWRLLLKHIFLGLMLEKFAAPGLIERREF